MKPLDEIPKRKHWAHRFFHDNCCFLTSVIEPLYVWGILVAPDIRNYTDLVEFLIDFFAFRKLSNSQWSFRSWAHHLGFKSHANFLGFLNGRRKLTKNMELKLCEYFKFSSMEKSHFHQLCEWARFEFTNPQLAKKIKGLAIVDEDGKSFEIQCSRESFSPLITLLGELLRTAPKAYSIEDLRGLLFPEIKDEHLKSALERLLDLGLIIQTDPGLYIYSQKGKDVVMKQEMLNLKNSFALNLAAHNFRPTELTNHFFAKQAQFRLPASKFSEFEARLTQAIREIVTSMWTLEDEIVYDLVFSMQPMARAHSQLNSRFHQV